VLDNILPFCSQFSQSQGWEQQGGGGGGGGGGHYQSTFYFLKAL
jgi:hypothetical protein